MAKTYETITDEEWDELSDDEKRAILDEFNRDWRRPDGRLKRGHPGIPGGRTGRQPSFNRSDYNEAIAAAITPEDLFMNLIQIQEKARENDDLSQLEKLVRLALDRILGKPKEHVEVSASMPEQWRAQLEERWQESPILLPGEEVIEADFRDMGEGDNHGGEGRTGQGGEPAHAQPPPNGDLQMVDEE